MREAAALGALRLQKQTGLGSRTFHSRTSKIMHVERITTWNGLVALEPEWNALVDAVPFRSWDWLATWWKHYGEANPVRRKRARTFERQLNVLAVYSGRAENRRLCGIAPWYLERNAIHGDILRWLGGDDVCTDHLTLLCRPEDRKKVATAIADELTADCIDWDRLHLDAVDADDAAVNALVAELETRECHVTRRDADACWALDLPASWDDYLANISKSHRKQLRQLERRVLESNRAVWHPVAVLPTWRPPGTCSSICISGVERAWVSQAASRRVSSTIFTARSSAECWLAAGYACHGSS